ncbi:helix-turn-helix transcriptional regulator [Clostridium oceanicum]|uniref:Helix-turn-helix domain-containing protein n=1 Tax=Clostridium oceanicum TaxID=1543 RepID=A0ABN1JCC4_9CLOT
MVRNRLKEIRMREYLMNQKEFSEKVLKLSLSTYNPIEQNKSQGNIETILKIAKALNRSIEEIWYMV